jgi:hypothetical protein
MIPYGIILGIMRRLDMATIARFRMGGQTTGGDIVFLGCESIWYNPPIGKMRSKPNP